MYDGDRWKDSHDRRVAFCGFFEEMPAGLQRLLAAMSSAMLALLVIMGIDAVGDLSEGVYGLWSALAVATALILGGIAAPSWVARKWRQLEEAGLHVNIRSYAFVALERELAELKIHIRDMNDRIDYEVGIQHIVAYLRLTRGPSALIDSGHLDEAQQRQLTEAVDGRARAYAATIRYCFDQRELVRQALKRGDTEAAQQIETALRDRLRAEASARAEIWLTNHRLGLLG